MTLIAAPPRWGSIVPIRSLGNLNLSWTLVGSEDLHSIIGRFTRTERITSFVSWIKIMIMTYNAAASTASLEAGECQHSPSKDTRSSVRSLGRRAARAHFLPLLDVRFAGGPETTTELQRPQHYQCHVVRLRSCSSKLGNRRINALDEFVSTLLRMRTNDLCQPCS